jgi:DNA-binding NarL/FixJ family response regulator
MPSVLIVDDYLLARQGLKHMLHQEYRSLVFGEASTSAEATALLAKRYWDLVVLVIAFPAEDGFRTLQEIRRDHPSLRILVLSMHANPQYSVRARSTGANGYIHKHVRVAEFLKAVRNVLEGKDHFHDLPFTGTVTETVLLSPALSVREHAVMLALAAGKRNGEIAAELNLSAKTVSTYKCRILHKLQLHSTADVVRYVIDQHLSNISLLASRPSRA